MPEPSLPDHWRPLRAADLPGVLAIAAQAHPTLPEDNDVLAEKLALWPAGCFALENPAGLAGYLLSHPWRLGDIPKLNRRLGALPEAADTYYIHDIALHPAARGTGAGKSILRQLLAATAGWGSHALVAVNGTAIFWRHHGFAATEAPGLESYGPDAVYMVRYRFRRP